MPKRSNEKVHELPSNIQIAELLRKIARYLSLEGASTYRVLAYERAADTVASFPTSVARLALEGNLRSLPGIGESIEHAISEYVLEGRSPVLEEFERKYPPSVLELLELPGLGPRKAFMLWRELGVSSIESLREACIEGRVASIPGMGQRTQERLLAAINARENRPSRTLLGLVEPLCQTLLTRLRLLPVTREAEVAGSVRRRRSTVKDIDLVVGSSEPGRVMDAFVTFPEVAAVEERGPTKLVAVSHMGVGIDLRVVDPKSFGNLLQHATGSAEHNVALRALAQRRGFSVSEYGIEDTSTGGKVCFPDERAVYEFLGLPWIPPELREDQGEIEAALSGTLPSLIEESDLLGDLHVHSEWSDGKASILEMAHAAQAHGLQYICICDHSRSLGVARGLDIDRLLRQREEIARVNSILAGMTVLSGCEVDVLADGTLDFPDEVLASLDFVVASIHSSLNQTRDQIMRRLVAAMKNPHVDAIGHPTGRLLLRRPAYDVDVDELIKTASATGTALEVNASFERLDLPAHLIRRAISMGVRLVIDSDAHSPEGFDVLRYGVGEARRGWVEPSHVLNTLPLPNLRKILSAGN